MPQPLNQQPNLVRDDAWFERIGMEIFFEEEDRTADVASLEKSSAQLIWMFLALDGSPERSKERLDPRYRDAARALASYIAKKRRLILSAHHSDQADLTLFKQLSFAQVLRAFAPDWASHFLASQPGRPKGSTKAVSQEDQDIRLRAARMVMSGAKISEALEEIGRERGVKRGDRLNDFKERHRGYVRQLVASARDSVRQSKS